VVNESPYVNNLTRYSKNTYIYADRVNDILSYGGCVSRIKSTLTEPIALYRIVKILDGEVITSIGTYASKLERFGIIVSEQDDEGYYLVCTFCPNLVLPPDIKVFDPVNDPGVFLKLDTITHTTNMCNMLLSNNNASDILVGMVTGKHSIFFCGTIRLFNVFPPVTGLKELGFTYPDEFEPITGIAELGFDYTESPD
jgi:hypothetical protein